MTEQQPNKDSDTKPTTDHEIETKEESKPLTNEKANKQIEARPRYPPPAPGMCPPALDNVITMTVQLIITIWSIFTILSSLSVASDRDDTEWIIFSEIVCTYAGFAYFTYKIKRCIVVYVKFYKCISEWHDNEQEKTKHSDSSWSTVWCCCVELIYWIWAIFIFPVVIIWAMWQSFRFYQDRRKNAHSEDGHTLKTDKRVFNVWGLGMMVKSAAMITLFIQDFPLMIICAIIGNWTFFSVYLVLIMQKLIWWIKYMYDLGKFRVFYKEEDFAEHFAMHAIYMEYDLDLKCYDVIAIPYNARELELATLQVGDWILIYVGEEEYIDGETELNDDNSKIMVVYKNKHLKEKDNLECIDILGIPVQDLDDYFEGKTKKLLIAPENFHTINRWDGKLRLTLLNDIMYEEHHDNAAKLGAAVTDGKKGDGRTDVVETGTEVKSNENGTEVVNGGDNDGNDVNDAVAVDMKEKEDVDDEVVAADENEENVAADTYTSNNDNKGTEVNEENEEIVDNPEPITNDTVQSDDVENDETEKLTDSPVVIDAGDVNEENNDKKQGDNGGDYVSVPLTSNDDENENES